MRTRPFGETGFQVPVVGQGTWELERAGVEKASDALRRGIDLGMTHIDTAEMYGSGEVEKILAKALSGLRDRVFLVSKVMPRNASYQGTISACEASLRRLQTDRLDCYLLHWHEGRHPLEDTLRAFEKLRSDGKIASWGVSNFGVAQMEDAVRIAGAGKIACNQVEYHLYDLAIEEDLAPWCRSHGVALVGYSPFGQGRFPGLLSREGRALADIARDLGTTPRILALAYVIRLEDTFAIPKAAHVAHVEENAKAAALELTPAAVQAIGRVFRS